MGQNGYWAYLGPKKIIGPIGLWCAQIRNDVFSSILGPGRSEAHVKRRQNALFGEQMFTPGLHGAQ